MLSSLVYVSLPTLLSTVDLESAHDESELVQVPLLLLLFFSLVSAVMFLNFRIPVDVMCKDINVCVLRQKSFFCFVN